MEDIVAVKVVDEIGKSHFFITWGRIFDATEPESLLQALTTHLPKFGVDTFSSISLCRSLQEASNEPYFYEALFSFSQKPIPFGKKYQTWRKKRRKKIQKGREIYYCGKF